MKKQFLKLFGILFLASGLLASCSSDDDNNGSNDDDQGQELVINPADFKGDITGDVTLDASKVYNLTGPLIVHAGGKLRVPAGTRIEGTAGTSSYIAVAQEGQIFVNGEANNPVVMTSGLPNPSAGDWGGVVICGRAQSNKGVAKAEVSELDYGWINGDHNGESSGSINYLRIEYSGAAYNSEKEFNGISFFGVGSGTVVQYVQVHEGDDDGFEWFGGTVSANYLVATGSADDQFDWTEGWRGSGNYWYGKRSSNPDHGNRGIEADNSGDNHEATPTSFPTIKYLTLIGNGIGEENGSENQAAKLRVGTKGIFDNVVLSNYHTGFDIQHDYTLSHIPEELRATNVKFDNIQVKAVGKNSNGEVVDVSNFFTEDNNASGAGNGTQKPAWAQGWTVGL